MKTKKCGRRMRDDGGGGGEKWKEVEDAERWTR